MLIVNSSESGVVNIYNNEEAKESKAPGLIKELLHLTTQITHLTFNHDSQILAMASRDKRDALKLVHTGLIF